MSDIFQQGYLALPAGETPARTVLVLHAWWGLNEFFKQVCDRLAQEGFVAFAPDMYEGRVATTIEQAEQYGRALDGKAEQTIRWLRDEVVPTLGQHPRVGGGPVGVIAVSLGVYYALQLLTYIPEQLGAVVVFYGAGGVDFGEAGRVFQGAFQGHFAENDVYEPKSNQDDLWASLQTAGIDATFYEYPGTSHWFIESNQPTYNAAAAELAWQRTVAFLKAQL
jgi:carboxymethylenebutenolidase